MTVSITAIRQASHPDLEERYASERMPICRIEAGQVFYSENGEMPLGFCPRAWQTLFPYVNALCHGASELADVKMKNPKSVFVSCNDGLRPFSFLLETMDGNKPSLLSKEKRITVSRVRFAKVLSVLCFLGSSALLASLLLDKVSEKLPLGAAFVLLILTPVLPFMAKHMPVKKEKPKTKAEDVKDVDVVESSKKKQKKKKTELTDQSEQKNKKHGLFAKKK